MRIYASSFTIAAILVCYFATSVECFHFQARKLLNTPTLSRHGRLSELRYQKHEAYNDNSMYVPPKYVVDVVKKRKNQQVTVADVSVATGVNLVSAQRDIMQLAHVCGGGMQVTKQGEIIYTFSSNFESAILRNSLVRRAQLFYEKVAPTLEFVFRASFGVCLVASLAVITVALTVAMASKSVSTKDEDNDDKRRRRRATQHHHHHHYRGPSFVTYIDLTDVLRVILRNAQGNDENAMSERRDWNKIGFLESFFSFVFGDGNPNHDFEERASAEAARLIRQSKGTVVAEQLVPYLSSPPSLLNHSMHDESYVLPLLLRFNGQPHVTAKGDIAYTFPDLLPSGQQGQQHQQQQQLQCVEPAFEETIPFSRADTTMLWLAGALAGMNLLGALVLGRVVHSSASWVKKVYPLLLSYAVMFTGVPLFRFVRNWKENNNIRARNDRRREWLHYTESDKQYREKLQAVSHEGNITSIRGLEEDQTIVFDTNWSDS